MKKIFSLIGLSAFLLLSACGKSGSNNNSNNGYYGNGQTVIPVGTYAVAGTIVQIAPNCGTSIANVTVQGLGSASINVGGTFNFPIGNMGYAYSQMYPITVQAGNCRVSGNIQPITSGGTFYQICLGQGCTCTNQCVAVNKASNKETSSISKSFPGKGDIYIKNSTIHLKGSKTANFQLNVEASNGNDVLSAEPALAPQWQGQVDTAGKITVGGTAIPALKYTAQVDAALMQFTHGFCDTSETAVKRMGDYAVQNGFTASSVESLKASYQEAAITERVCIYPQDTETVARMTTLKSENKLLALRLWFVVVPESDLVVKTQSGSNQKLALRVSRPQSDVSKAGKKSAVRKVASDNDILVEEIGLGVVIQK